MAIATKQMTVLEEACRASIRKNRTLDAAAKLPFVHVYQSKDPYHKKGGSRALNFAGRGRCVSNKNMQMESDDGQVVLQMAQWDKDVYNVDFCAPLTMYQAFGFALAQMEL